MEYLKKLKLIFYFGSFTPKVFLLFCCLFFSIFTKLKASEPISIEFNNQSLSSALAKLEKQTNYSFSFQDEVTSGEKINEIFEGKTISEILDAILAKSDYSYAINGQEVIIYKKTANTDKKDITASPFAIKGVVVDEKGEKLMAASVQIKGEKIGTTTDLEGAFSILTNNKDAQLIISYIGYKSKVVSVRNASLIKLEPNTAVLENVVVTGVYTRKAENFTGASTQISQKDLGRVGNQNVIQSLRLLDPSIYVPDNLMMGSDPNTMPNISMRGATSFPLEETGLKSRYQNQPNQPLFILDGFETSLEHIVDMDMNRIERVTLLKDASAKSLYGSKAANGVIVIETKSLEGNQQLVTYSGSVKVQVPDLRSYNLTNALEKLDVELVHGFYSADSENKQYLLSKLYNSRRKLALEGLDTYWLSKPLRTGIVQKHNLGIEVGDSRNLRALLNFNYSQTDGIMKESLRRNISGDAKISYRTKNLKFSNNLTVTSNGSIDSPYGNFGDYVKMNPYWQATDENGNLLRWASFEEQIPNPMYDATIGTSFKSTYFQFINNFYTEWQVFSDLKLEGRIGVSTRSDDSDKFYPALHSVFESYIHDTSFDLNNPGEYTYSPSKQNVITGEFIINYKKNYKKHHLSADARASISSEESETLSFKAVGFKSMATDISHAKQYATGSIPQKTSILKRNVSFMSSFAYDFDSRYLLDATFTRSASSLYGSNNRWADASSVGLGWNLHNESWLKESRLISQLRLKGTYGISGNQNFNTNESIGTYNFHNGEEYNGFSGSYLVRMPNPDLKWEQEVQYNLGFDMIVKKLNIKFNYFYAKTKDMLTTVTIPSSAGFSSVKNNLGLVSKSGIELLANYTLWSGNKGFFSIFGSLAYTQDKIIRLTENMKDYNSKIKNTLSHSPLNLFEDGCSMNTLWVVPSAGIDPTTGMEVFIKKDGSNSYTYSNDDLIPIGNTEPKYKGFGGINAEYKGWGINVAMSYQTGFKRYNNTLVERVEDANFFFNVDRRVFLDRWREPGQIALFKRLDSKSKTYPTSRFVQNVRELNISSVNLYYEVPSSIYRKLKMQRLRLALYMENVAQFSSIKIERGLNYPFAREMSLQITATF